MSELNDNKQVKLFRDDIDYGLSKDVMDMMEKSYSSLSPKLKYFNQGILETMDVNDFNLQEKSKVALHLTQGWLGILYAERENLKKLHKERDRVKEEYIATLDNNLKIYVLENKAENECGNLKIIDQAIEAQEEVIRFLEESNKILKNLGFTIKNSIDLLKIESM